MTPTLIVGYLALFVLVGFLFVFLNLLLGRFMRPKDPNAEKLEVYECGEPTIGSSFVQFDLRFYVIALLFIIFDVEVAFFFPWAMVFGKSTHLMDANLYQAPQAQVDLAVGTIFNELGVATSAAPSAAQGDLVRSVADRLALASIVDILVFFAVLMVGFAYVWRRGDLDWVRALSAERAQSPRHGPRPDTTREPALAIH